MTFMIKPANYADILTILHQARAADKTEILATEFDEDLERIAHKYANYCDFGIIFYGLDGTPIAFLAGATLWPHMVQIGFAATQRWGEIAFGVSRFLRRMRDLWLEEREIRQLFCFALEESKANNAWLHWLGFTEKCHLPQMGKNAEDFLFLTYQRKETQCLTPKS